MSAKAKTTKATKTTTKAKKAETPAKVTLEVIKPYYDLEEKCNRKVGDTYETTKERAEYVARLGYGKML